MKYTRETSYVRPIEDLPVFFALLPHIEEQVFPEPARLTQDNVDALREEWITGNFFGYYTSNDEGLLTGFATVYKERRRGVNYGEIDNVVVLPPYRGRGLSNILCEECYLQAQRKGWALSAQTIETNTAMRKVFDSMLECGIFNKRRMSRTAEDYFGDGRMLRYVQYRR